MPRTLLIALLILALFLELTLTLGGFFARPLLLAKFGVALTPDTSFLAYVLAWLLLFVSLICGLALGRIWQRRGDYATLCYVLGWWWVGIGIGIYVAFGRPNNLLLDSLKGALLIVLTNRSRAAGY